MNRYVMFSYLSYTDSVDGARFVVKKQAHLDGSGMGFTKLGDYLKHSMTLTTLQMLVSLHIDELYSPPDPADGEETTMEYRVYRVVLKWFLVRDEKIERRIMNPGLANKLDLLCDL